ncbi:hypothetical protein [Burkholderia anthina]|uniref:hypothetical protein n=1 Tax=Burkholderia anthina TaxID=179879 RepID=UPI0037BE2775
MSRIATPDITSATGATADIYARANKIFGGRGPNTYAALSYLVNHLAGRADTTVVVVKQSTGSCNWRCEIGHAQETRTALRRRFPSAGAANRRALEHYPDLVMETCNA